MIRRRLFEHGVGPTFRNRGSNVSRIEGFSDAVFAFAVTLLVVSLTVPHTFGELLDTMKGFGAFALSFAALVLLWYEHYLFFRRYNLQDIWTMIINSAFLFVVLLFVFPLKFLSTVLIKYFTGEHPIGVTQTGAPIARVFMIAPDQVPSLFVIYGCGFVAVYTLFALFHAHAASKAQELEFTPTELVEVKYKVLEHFGTAMVGALSVVCALLVRNGVAPTTAALVYLLLPPIRLALKYSESKQRIKLQRGQEPETRNEPGPTLV